MSRQDYQTPRDFIAAVERRFGRIGFDLAAHAENRVSGCYFGPGSRYAEDALVQPWAERSADGSLSWLNPPFQDIAPWAKKCDEESQRGARIAFLVLASIGTNWFRDHVHGKCQVFALNPRVKFVGAGGDRDLMLCLYDQAQIPGFAVWRWKP